MFRPIQLPTNRRKTYRSRSDFIDGTKIEANANKFTFVWKKSIEKYHQSLTKKSNQLYNELIENEIIPEIENESELSSHT